MISCVMNRETDKQDPDIINRMIVNWSYKPIESTHAHFKEDYLKPIVDLSFDDWMIDF